MTLISKPMFYPRDEIVAVITDYYTFLCRILHGPHVLALPPQGGWPHITPESMAALNRNSDVIDLLRHLPYLRRDDGGRADILPETDCADYAGEYCFEGLREGKLVRVEPPLDDPLDADCVSIAYGRRHAYSVFLDLTHGTVIWYNNDGSWGDEDYDLGSVLEVGSPRAPGGLPEWREEPTYDMKYFFGEFCKKRLNEMAWLGKPDGEMNAVGCHGVDEEDKIRRRILADAGFPGDGNGSGFDWEKWKDDERHHGL